MPVNLYAFAFKSLRKLLNNDFVFFFREEVDKTYLRHYLFIKIFCLRFLDLFDNFNKTRQKITSLMDLIKRSSLFGFLGFEILFFNNACPIVNVKKEVQL